MRFDDRLTTALSQPAGSPRDRAVRWRQLVDLVARGGHEADTVLIDRAIAVIREDAPEVEERLRAAAARAIAGMPVPTALLSAFAADRLTVAAPLLAGAPIDDDALMVVRDAASDEVRRFLDSLRPSPVAKEETVAAPVEAPEPPVAEPSSPVPSISDVVARIERRRTALPTPRPIMPPPAAADTGSPMLFRWECGPGGEIEWVDGAPRGPLVGRTIAAADPDEGVDDCVERAFTVRAPFRDCVLELAGDGSLAGQWSISGLPAFAPADGRFIGYRGIARRGLPDPAPAASDATLPAPAATDHVALREMIHEIRTPLNAIIGFAEIIDGQYLGPAHSRYRERAAEIVVQARSLLQAAEDLDFAARLQSARAKPGDGTEIASFLPPFADDLMTRAARQGALVSLDAPDRGARCALDPDLVERLLRRFTDAVLSAAGSGEQLIFRLVTTNGHLAFRMTRPQSLAEASRNDLLNPEFSAGSAGPASLGIGFSLRLLNGLIGIAGGELAIGADDISLMLPAGPR